MSMEDRLVDLLEDPERRARAFRYAWWISLGFVFFGYAYIAYVLFF